MLFSPENKILTFIFGLGPTDKAIVGHETGERNDKRHPFENVIKIA